MATLSHRKQVIAIKVEGTEGTDAVPTATDAAFFQFNAAFNPDVEQHERNPFRTTIGSLTSIAGVKRGSVTFESELSGDGTAGNAPPLDAVFKGCHLEQTPKTGVVQFTLGTVTSGPFQIDETIDSDEETGDGKAAMDFYNGDPDIFIYSTTGTWTGTTANITGATSGATAPVSSLVSEGFVMYRPKTTPSSNQSVTIYHHIDGLRHDLLGCRGNMKVTAETSGSPIKVEFEFIGKHNQTSDQTLITPTYPTTTAPTFKDAKVNLQDGFEARCDSIELDLGNEIDISRNASDTSGLGSTQIIQRSGSGSIDPELDLVAQHDFFSKLFNNTTGSISFFAGSTGGNQVAVQAPLAQYAGMSQGERTGIEILNIDLALTESSANGDDDLVLIFY